MSTSAVDITHILKIAMTPKRGAETLASHPSPIPKCWLGYTVHAVERREIGMAEAQQYEPSSGDMVTDYGRPGDRLLDLDVRNLAGRQRFTFEVAVDYRDHGADHTVAFADPPFTFGWLGGPDLGSFFQAWEVSDDRKWASFELDLEAAAKWGVATHLRGVNCPVVRVPIRINLTDSQFPFPSWMMPEPGDPAYDDHDHEDKVIGSMAWHGGPHPPIETVVVIPTGA